MIVKFFVIVVAKIQNAAIVQINLWYVMVGYSMVGYSMVC